MAKNKQQKARAQQARKQRRNEKQKKKQQQASKRVSVGVRIKERLAKQVPEAWAGENLSDAAVFDEAAFQTLEADLQSQVTNIRESLQLVCKLKGSDAAARVAGIPRSSPLSEWRLLVRGLTSWLENDFSAAKEIWNRLDPQRRPGRIATAMIAAALPDLEDLTLAGVRSNSVQSNSVAFSADQATVESARPAESALPAESEAAAEPESVDASLLTDTSLLTNAGVKNRLDTSLLQSARLLRRVRIDRVAIRMALTGATIPEEDSDLLIGPAKMKWLRSFSNDFESTEPQLVSALHRTALLRAFHQSYTDLFSAATGFFKGPDHDRQNELLSFFYYNGSDERSEQSRHFLNYVDMYLKSTQRISEPLRQALISECCHMRAAQLISEESERPFYMRFDEGQNDREIERLLRKSIAAFPDNRKAFQTYTEWLKEKLDDSDAKAAAEREPLIENLAGVMKKWSESRPDDVEPRLWLVEYLLENGELEQAQPFIEWLRVARQDDAKIRALPWKWQLLNTMQLCRRKSSLEQVPEKLQCIESEWPAWLSKDWLAYLHAAFQLRSGNTTEYEQQRTMICEQKKRVRDCPRDACMMLAAAQEMSVSPADLKPLRAVVDTAVRNVKKISTEDLLDLGEFYWDLHRIQVIYPAYRMHGSKFGRELKSRVNSVAKKIREWLPRPAFRHSLLWASEYRFWPENNDSAFPKCLELPSFTDPLIAAVRINSIPEGRNSKGLSEISRPLTLLRNALETELDPYYRSWFASLVEKTDQRLAAMPEKMFGFGRMVAEMAKSMGFSLDDLDFDDDDDDDDDEVCNCPSCVAERAEEARQRLEQNVAEDIIEPRF